MYYLQKMQRFHLYVPQDRRLGAYCFCPVCHSILLSSTKNFNNLGYHNNFWMVSTKTLIFHMHGYQNIWPCDFDLLIENFHLGYIFWLVGTRALTFYMSAICDKIFSRVQKKLTLTLVFHLLIKNFNLGYIFWMVHTRTLIFHVGIFCDKTFPMGTITKKIYFVTMVFDLLIENFHLGYIFWMVGTKTLTFHMSIFYHKTFRRVPKNWPCGLDLGVWPTYLNFILCYIFRMGYTRTLIFHSSVPYHKTFSWYQ
jgi:hypothetical protein